ncbi:MAG: GNAT family N-acetyltransferase [Azospirillaceae bacterium]
MDDLIIEDAREDDLPAVVGLLADDTFGQSRERAVEPLPEGYRRAFAAIAGDPRTWLLVARQDGRVVATLQVHFLANLTYQGGERCQIEGVRVARDCQGQGLGRRLIDWVVGQAQERGCVMVQLTTNAGRPEARRFYEGLGFKASHVGMKRDLN